MDRGYMGKQFDGMFTPDLADQQVEQLFASEFGYLLGYHVEVHAAPVSIKGEFPNAITLLANYTWREMEVVIIYEYLSGAHGEEVIEEVSVSSENVRETFLFLPPYAMVAHSNDQNGLSWDDGIIAYKSLFQTLTEATANFAHLYAKGIVK
jgi:hypothetical protein